MAVIVSDTRTLISEADADVGGTWTGGGGEFGSPFVEASAAWVGTLNTTAGQIYFTRTTAIDITNQLVYIWSNNFALQFGWDTDPISATTGPPNAMHLGDGTNRISIKMAGADRKVFSHLDAQDWNWDCLLVDTLLLSTLNTDGRIFARAGTFAGYNVAATTQFGADMRTESKGLGGGTNVAVDIIRVGNDGLVITGGVTGDRGTFFEIVVEDRSTLTGKAHGIIREYATGLYGIQGPLTFGSASGASWFQDSNVTVAFENRDVANDKYYIATAGGTGETHFILLNSTILSTGPFVTLDFSANDVDTLTLQDCSFRQLGNSITFGNDVSASGHIVNGCVFVGCGQIDLGLVEFENNIISDTTNVTGSLLINNASRTLLFDNTINSGITGHGLLLSSSVASEITLNAIFFNGFGANETTGSAVYNNSGKAVTVNIVGGGTIPTVRNGVGASTTVVAAVNITVSGLRDNTEVRVYAADSPGSDELAGVENATDGTVDNRSFTFSLQGGTAIDIQIVNLIYEIVRIENYIVPAVDASIPIQQRIDRNYFNP